MSDDVQQPARFQTGAVLRVAFDLVIRHDALLLLIGLIGSVLILLVQSAIGALRAGPVFRSLTVLISLIQYVLQASVMAICLGDFTGTETGFAASLTSAARAFPPMLCIGFLLVIGLTIGFILLVVPGIMLSLRWCLARVSARLANTPCSTSPAMAANAARSFRGRSASQVATLMHEHAHEAAGGQHHQGEADDLDGGGKL
jgi:hypothetical protein